MKNKILTFIIGLLVGAIITTAIFFVYLKVNKNENTTTNQETHQMQMPGGERGEMTPPDMQNGESQKPSEESQESNNNA